MTGEPAGDERPAELVVRLGRVELLDPELVPERDEPGRRAGDDVHQTRVGDPTEILEGRAVRQVVGAVAVEIPRCHASAKACAGERRWGVLYYRDSPAFDVLRHQPAFTALDAAAASGALGAALQPPERAGEALERFALPASSARGAND